MPNNNQIISQQQQGQVVKYYKPSELLGMFTSYLSQQDMNKQVISLQGIYLKNPKHDARWSCRYDILRDENTQTEITLQIPYKLCEDLKDGNLVTVGGVLGRRVQNNSHIQLMLVVSRVEIIQEQTIDVDPDLQVTKVQLLDLILNEIASDGYTESEQSEFWDDMTNLQKAKIVR